MIADLDGTRIAYEDSGGSGHVVVLVMGTGSPGRVWNTHQVPALRKAGYRVVTFNNRGIAPSDICPSGFTMDDMVGDVVGLIEHVGCGTVSLVGTSLGARIVTETALSRPDLVTRAVALAAHARLDPVQRAMTLGEIALADGGDALPDHYRAAVTALQYLSPATLRNENTARDWLEIFALSDGSIDAGHRAQLKISADLGTRLSAYRAMAVPLLVVAFADDVAIPPRLSREVAEAVPGARYVEVADAGHYGYLERPEEVNRLILDFLGEAAPLSDAEQTQATTRRRHA